MNKSDLPKFDPDVYTRITLNELVIFSIHYLHNKNAEISPEDIISTCFMLFPKKFSLKQHPHWPDSAMVSRHWNVCRSKGYIAANDPEFKLTAKGIRLAEKVAACLGMEMPKRAATPAVKIPLAGREGKMIRSAAVKEARSPRSKVSVLLPTHTTGVKPKGKAASPMPAEKFQPSRSTARVEKHVKKAQPIQTESAAPPAPIKKASPVKKGKIAVIEKKEKITLQPIVKRKQATPAKARVVKQAKEVRPAQKEKAVPPAPMKKAPPAQLKKTPSAKKEKLVLQPAAGKIRSSQVKARPAQAKIKQPASKKIAPARPVKPTIPVLTGRVRKTRPAPLMKGVRPIWAEKTKPPEPIVRPVVEKAQPMQAEKTIPPAQSVVTQEIKIRAGKFVRAMETSDAYIHYKKHGKSSKISEFDFRSLLLCTMESPPETLARNMQQFKGFARIHNRQDLIAFLDFCEDKLSHLLAPQTNRLAKPARK